MGTAREYSNQPTVANSFPSKARLRLFVAVLVVEKNGVTTNFDGRAVRGRGSSPAWRVARSRAGFFPVRAAFPDVGAGRRPHHYFRGLLKLHTRYGLQSCSPSFIARLRPGRFPGS